MMVNMTLKAKTKVNQQNAQCCTKHWDVYPLHVCYLNAESDIKLEYKLFSHRRDRPSIEIHIHFFTSYISVSLIFRGIIWFVETHAFLCWQTFACCLLPHELPSMIDEISWQHESNQRKQKQAQVDLSIWEK